MTHHEDEALSRMRASDPATGSHPDLHSLRRLVGAKAPASQADGEAVRRLADDGMRGQRVRAPWIAAAAVAALGIGAGGYALGLQNAPDTTTAGGTGTTVASPGSSTEGDAGAMADGAAVTGEAYSTDAGAGEATDKAMAGSSSAMYDPGPVRLTAGPGLPTERSTAQMRMLTSDENPQEFLQSWADRMSFQGTSLPQDSNWYGQNAVFDTEKLRVISADTTGGALQFMFEDIAGNPDCASMYEGISEEDLAMVKDEWAKGVGADVPFPDASVCREVSGERPTDEQAVAAAEDFFATTGLDLSAFEIRVPEYVDETGIVVPIEATPKDGHLNQLSLSAQVGPEGVYSAWGTVGEMTSLGDYPVISATEAVARYGLREFSMDYGVTLEEDMDPVIAETSIAGPDYTLPDPPPVEPGMKLQLMLKEKVVTSAELTRGTMWTQSGSVEVPAWKLVTEDGMHYAVLAIADEAIDWVSWSQ